MLRRFGQDNENPWRIPRRKILGEKGYWEKKIPRRKRFLGEKGSYEKDPRRSSFLGHVSQEQFLPGALFLEP